MKRVDCHFTLGGEERRGYLVKVNNLTAWVRPYSKWPQCVELNSLQTKTIKRHLVKHKVNVNLAHRPSLGGQYSVIQMARAVEVYYARH
jgi:hypothetical protein